MTNKDTLTSAAFEILFNCSLTQLENTACQAGPLQGRDL